ncbi:MAG: YeeE/YedE thiosulfate transporter family protein [Prosthecobacter sp.]|uniref:YeeE/YedE thiosulfate transporter family protein n=1 Tax=Prosthecobacter sp. TaxID=1965333 RepID=UPI003BAF179A
MKTHRWNPYLVGALIGVLSILTFTLADKPIGISTGIAQASGACALPVLGADGVAANTYWAKKAVPAWDYGSLFVLGSFFGALASALVSGSFKLESVPTIWRERFGPSVGKRFLAAFLGGVVLIFGARLADGCTSGHGISGSLQLAVSSWTFFIAMFISGIVTAFLFFRSTSKS